MVQTCVDAANTDLSSYNSKKTRDAADVVGSKSSSINNVLHHHIRTLGSMQSGSVDFVSTVLPVTTEHTYSPQSTELVSSESAFTYKTNTTISSSSSSGYESVLSHSSKSHRSLFSRLKRLINFPSTKKSSDYQLATVSPFNETNHSTNSPLLSCKNHLPAAGSHMHASNTHEHRRNSLTRLDIRRKSARRTLAPPTQHIPFTYGLKNCGNTCFINAIVQCLCHTEQLALYLLRKGYEVDMRNIKNAISDYQHSSSQSPPPPSIGFKVTKSVAQIFQALWNNSSNTTSKLLYDFKSIIGNLNRQYSGTDQNDAQEFLLFLINTIHDELNLVGNGRYRQQSKHSFSSVITSSSLSSAELARRSWSDYTDANQSIITSIFSAQLHSTLRCNQCKQESKTFEPYLLLSLPIPQKIIKPVFVTVVFLNQSPKQLQIGLCLPVTNTVKDVREAIAQQSNLDPTELALVEIQQHNGFFQVFHDTEPMSRLTHDIYAIQFPSESTEDAAPTAESSSPASQSFVNLLVLNRIRYNSGHVERFGAPIAVRVPRESNYRALQLSIIKAQRSIIRDEAMEYAQEFVVFQLSLIDQYQSTLSVTEKQEYPIVHDVQWPLYLEKIVEILDAYDGPGLGPSHIQVYANWPEKYIEQFISKWGANDDKPDIHQSVAQARAALHQPSSSSISLADCFSLFTQSESLNHDDAWMCTHCRRKENGTVKNLKISTIPPVLIIHLKRFCQTKLSNAKLVYPVQFPLVDLDIQRFSPTNSSEDERDKSIDTENPDQPTALESHSQKPYGLYDLYAVCNHRGTMSNGHYTAYCKNPVTGKWFCYDDHLVSELDSSRVCTPDAYILFYRRRDTASPASPSPSPSMVKSPSAQPLPLLPQQQQMASIVDNFDYRFRLDPSSRSQPSSRDDKLIWTSPKDKPNLYTLEAPLPLPRKFLTPLSLSSSQDDVTLVQAAAAAPCPAPRIRKSQYELEVASAPSRIILPPSPALRRQPLTATVNYVYPLTTLPADELLEPYDQYSSSSSSHRFNQANPPRANPWNRYNSSRYSDSEQDSNVVYQTTILR